MIEQKKIIIDILTNWITIVKSKNMIDQLSNILLLRDFAYGTIWSDDFYKKKAEKAFISLSSFDQKKKEVQIVSDYLIPIIKEYMIDSIKPVGIVATSRERSDRNRIGLA